MLDKFEYGLRRAFDEIIVGSVPSITISIIVSTGLVPSYFIWFFHLFSVIGMIILIQKMPNWATSYIVGWLVGVIILAYSDLITITNMLIYLIPLVFLIYRWKGKFSF